jgi:putative membrane protein
MKRLGLIAVTALGLSTILYLIVYIGVGPVLDGIASLGWGGFALVCGLNVSIFALLSCGWYILVPPGPSRRWATFFFGRAVRDCAGDVLPLSQFGGFVIGARAIALRGVAAAEAYASTVVDVTTELMAQVLFIALGSALFLSHLGLEASHSKLFLPLLLGPFIAALCGAGFVIVQQKGPKFADALAGHVLPKAMGKAGAFARRIVGLYSERWRVILSISIHFTGWMASAFVAWLIVRLIGGHMSYRSMVAIEAALSAIRSAAVFVPSAIGVQEASYALLLPLFGSSAAVGLALSLVKRAASIAVGVPVLLSWQGLEGRHALALDAARDERLSEN